MGKIMVTLNMIPWYTYHKHRVERIGSHDFSYTCGPFGTSSPKAIIPLKVGTLFET